MEIVDGLNLGANLEKVEFVKTKENAKTVGHISFYSSVAWWLARVRSMCVPAILVNLSLVFLT